MESLEKLAEVARRVAEGIKNINAVNTADNFFDLQSDLNELQVATPLFAPAFDARAAWYLHGLENFECCLVRGVEQRAKGWEKWAHHSPGRQDSPPGLIMGSEQIVFFLTHGYLGKAFAEIYPRVEALFDRLVEATKGTNRHELWVERRENIRRAMLEGRI